MSKRPTLTDLTSLTNSSAINTLSQNWDAIEEAFDNTLSLDGSTPNAMNADLDLNGNSLLNVGAIDVADLTFNGQQITDLASVPEWRGSWLTTTSYVKNDLVKTNGNAYICLEAHTSGTFSTDLTNLKWELMVSKGDSGSGTGDVVSTNNLSDLTSFSTARSNLGLGTVAVENIVPVSKGGTGATDAATARTNLVVQPLNTNLTTLAGLTPTKGSILVGDGTSWQTVGVGADGEAIVADSAEDTGVKWGSVSSVPSTSDVLAAVAGASAGAIGTYAFAYRSSDVAFGSTAAGSSLTPTSAARGYIGAGSPSLQALLSAGSALSGTWRCMGTFDASAASGTDGSSQSATLTGATLWLRIS